MTPVHSFEKKCVFLCHASEDKEKIVRPLARALEREGISFWLDEAEIKWGDSIPIAINNGIRISRFVIIIISDIFFQKNWTQIELSAFIGIEAWTGTVQVLPIMAVDDNIIIKHYPLLASKFYLKWSNGLSGIISHLKARIREQGVGDDLFPHCLSTLMENRMADDHKIASWPDSTYAHALQNIAGYGAMINGILSAANPQHHARSILSHFVYYVVKYYFHFIEKIEPHEALNYAKYLLEVANKSQKELSESSKPEIIIASVLKKNDNIRIIKDSVYLDQLCDKTNISSQEIDGLREQLFIFFTNCVRLFSPENDTADVTDIRKSLASGESATVEFKETLRWDAREKIVNKAMSKAVARTIAGFLNNQGGILLIGVDDNGGVIGLDRDLVTFPGVKKDSFQRFFVNLLETNLDGTAVESFVSGNFVEVDGKIIFLVKVNPGKEPTFLIDGNQIEYCVRVSATTKSHNVKEAINHHKMWWSMKSKEKN
jgi:hypothetical protein